MKSNQIVKRLCGKHPTKQMYNRQYVSPLFFKQNIINLCSLIWQKIFYCGKKFKQWKKKKSKIHAILVSCVTPCACV